MTTTTSSITFDHFKLESKNILNELESYYETKKRQIDICFQILFDNLPNEIRHTPINKIYESYMNAVERKPNHDNQSVDSDQTEEDDEIDMTEFQDETVHIDNVLDKESVKNLTSTVKKVNNHLKDPNFLPKTKFDSIINEQSIITENERNTNDDKYAVGIYYYLKDGTKATTKISEIQDIDIKDAHANCVDDLNDLFKFYSLLFSKKK